MHLPTRFFVASILLGLCKTVLGLGRTVPPAGAFVVRAGTSPSTGEFDTITGAVNVLPNDNSAQTIFIFPGTYTEQVNITRPGPLTILGYTVDTSSYLQNTVTIQFGLSAAATGSDDISGTLRIHKNDFKMYNVDVKNTFGVGSQAIAISQYGTRVGLYGCGFFGFQDTVLAEQGTQVFLKGYIEGATDFIFGQRGQAYFEGNTIAVTAAGYVTASGRTSNDGTSYVFNENTIVLGVNAASNTAGRAFLGRPWGDFAKVIFKNTIITAPLNKTMWSIWDVGDERIDNVFLADFNSTGSGVTGAQRASFAQELTADQAAAFNISSAIGSDFASWVDTSYLA